MRSPTGDANTLEFKIDDRLRGAISLTGKPAGGRLRGNSVAHSRSHPDLLPTMRGRLATKVPNTIC
jgi:hypothetical protein